MRKADIQCSLQEKSLSVIQLCRGCWELLGKWDEPAQQRGDTNGIQRFGRKSTFRSLISLRADGKLAKKKKINPTSSCYNRSSQRRATDWLTGQYCNIIFSEEATLENKSARWGQSSSAVIVCTAAEPLKKNHKHSHGVRTFSAYDRAKWAENGLFPLLPSQRLFQASLSLKEKWPSIALVENT